MTGGATGGATGAGWLAEVPLAHRGLHGDGVPENSLAAFAAARDAGVGVELDVRLSADGVPVVVHDRTLLRVAGRRDGVAGLTAAELAEVRLGHTDEHVPTLAAALDVLGERPVMVEVKAESVRATSLEPAVAAVVEAHDGPTCVASFSPMSVRWFRRHAPDVVRVLTAMPTVVPLRGRDRRLANLGLLGAVEPAAVSYDVHGLDLPAVRRWRESGRVVITWTVRTEADLVAARAGADNLIFEDLSVASLARPADHRPARARTGRSTTDRDQPCTT